MWKASNSHWRRVIGSVVVPEGRKIPQGLLVALSNHARTNGQAGGWAKLVQMGHSRGRPCLSMTMMSRWAGRRPGDDFYVSAIRRADEDVLSPRLHVDGANTESSKSFSSPAAVRSRWWYAHP